MPRGMLFSWLGIKVEIKTYAVVAQLRQETRPKARHDILAGIDPYRKCAFSASRNDLIKGIKRKREVAFSNGPFKALRCRERGRPPYQVICIKLRPLIRLGFSDANF